MPQRGDLNEEFGVYKTLCCGQETVIPAGESFPDCPNHPNLPTIWKSASFGRIPKAADLVDAKKKKDSAA